MLKTWTVSCRILDFWHFLKLGIPGSTRPTTLPDNHQLRWAVAAHLAFAGTREFVISVLKWRQMKKTNRFCCVCLCIRPCQQQKCGEQLILHSTCLVPCVLHTSAHPALTAILRQALRLHPQCTEESEAQGANVTHTLVPQLMLSPIPSAFKILLSCHFVWLSRLDHPKQHQLLYTNMCVHNSSTAFIISPNITEL